MRSMSESYAALPVAATDGLRAVSPGPLFPWLPDACANGYADEGGSYRADNVPCFRAFGLFRERRWGGF